MKYIDEFRDIKIAKNIVNAIFKSAKGLKPVTIMEVCGTHAMAIERFGIRGMLPENIRLVSGPGCPVCVTPKSYIDKALFLCEKKDFIVATFGDMLKVPGSYSSLISERAKGNVKTVYSSLDALGISLKQPDKKIVFLGIGFETTAPTIAMALKHAKDKKIKNFFVLSGHKIMPPAMEALLKDKDIKVDGFLCPAHVSVIIGAGPYEDIIKRYNVPCVIAGFEPLDILKAIFIIITQIKTGKIKFENEYDRVVKRSGNKKAINIIKEVFDVRDSEWRGIGIIPKSGLFINKRYSGFDIENKVLLSGIKTKKDKGCICGSILKGIKAPVDCRLFGRQCTPETPAGACMVSSEGACAAYYRYRNAR